MTVDRKAMITGTFLIVLGLLFLAANFYEFDWEELWPLFMIAGGLAFFAVFLTDRRHYGLLMPASILFIYGALFQFCALTYWDYMEVLWPTFILGPGVGLLMMYLLGCRETGLLIPASILIGIAAIFFVTFGPFQMYARYWPVLLILAGLWLLLRRRNELSEKTS